MSWLEDDLFIMYYHPVNVRDYGDVYGCDVYSTQMKRRGEVFTKGLSNAVLQESAIGLPESATTPD
jgi:hypothetical protein